MLSPKQATRIGSVPEATWQVKNQKRMLIVIEGFMILWLPDLWNEGLSLSLEWGDGGDCLGPFVEHDLFQATVLANLEEKEPNRRI